jgi:GST-like protein
MIDVHYWPTPNGWKVTIMLEECGLPYTIVPVDIGAGEQFTPAFLRLSPNNRMPAIVDHAPLGGGDPITIFESGAILEYLADKSGQLLPREPRARYGVLQWVHWQMANLGPMMGNANHFKNYAKRLTDDPGQLEYGVRRFVGEVERLCGVMDAQLSAHRYLAGADYTIADVITWPWAMLLGRLIDDSLWGTFPNVKRWVDELWGRPAVQRGFDVGKEWRERQRTPEEEEKARAVLFNQTNESVRAAREAAAKASA